MITHISQLDLSGQYTYQDYLGWKFEERVELINGKIYQLFPRPSKAHQDVSGDLIYTIKHYFRDKSCKVYAAPFDLRLPLPPKHQKENKIMTVLQPDIFVVCDLSKLDAKGCLGAPDWVIEILSPSTSTKDHNEKFDVYEYAGVREYWIVHPTACTVLAYVLDEKGKFRLVRERPFMKGEFIPVGIFPDFKINLDEVFPPEDVYLA